MNLSETGQTLIKGYEKCRLKAYQDTKGVWTIGWGNTFYSANKPVKKGDTITQEQADTLFAEVIADFTTVVNEQLAGIQIEQYKFDALVSFTYNVGAKGFRKSTLLKYLKLDDDNPQIICEFLKWNISGGKVEPGLTRRRKSESFMYFTGKLNFFE